MCAKLQTYMHKLLVSLKAGARSRGIVVAIDLEDLLEMYVEQEGKCSLTGETMTWERGHRYDTRAAVSVDRKDSLRNYTLDNIHLVCRIVNTMKSDMPMEIFGQWCVKIVLHALEKQQPTSES
jgi:hypothetical protein